MVTVKESTTKSLHISFLQTPYKSEQKSRYQPIQGYMKKINVVGIHYGCIHKSGIKRNRMHFTEKKLKTFFIPKNIPLKKLRKRFSINVSVNKSALS